MAGTRKKNSSAVASVPKDVKSNNLKLKKCGIRLRKVSVPENAKGSQEDGPSVPMQRGSNFVQEKDGPTPPLANKSCKVRLRRNDLVTAENTNGKDDTKISDQGLKYTNKSRVGAATLKKQNSIGGKGIPEEKRKQVRSHSPPQAQALDPKNGLNSKTTIKPTKSSNESEKEASSANMSSKQKISGSKDIYEFLSQSSISDREDPTTDVVKKLIKEGKATVARHKRGKENNVKKLATRAAPGQANKIKYDRRKKKAIKTRKDFQPEIIEVGSSEIEICNRSSNHVVKGKSNANNDAKVQAQGTPLGNSNKNGQTSVARPMITDKSRLLQAAREFVNQSTPVSRKTVQPPENYLSPIYGTSPWRPPDERFLPRVFYFSRNEDDLPSYSSDVFPSSQPKKGTNELNLSNIENISPPGTTNSTAKEKVISNTRKTLGYRSPLKSINVLDVIELPARAKINDITKIPTNKSVFNKLTLLGSKRQNASIDTETQNNSNLDINNISVENCFGFDDIVDDENKDTNVTISSRKQLKAKLKSLKRLLPPKPTRASYSKIKSIFSEEPKQKDIREMLTSTVIETRNKEKPNITPEMNFDESINLTFETQEQNTTDLHLFDDLDEPKKDIDDSAKLKTYTRVPRRRKKIWNDLLLLSDDEFEEEAEEQEEEERPPKKMRTKPTNRKADVELNQFVEEFNSMCEEVEQYQLQVERVRDDRELFL